MFAFAFAFARKKREIYKTGANSANIARTKKGHESFADVIMRNSEVT